MKDTLKLNTLLFVFLIGISSTISANSITEQMSRSGGLAVLSGREAVSQAQELAKTQRWLTHILVVDAQAEDQIRAKVQQYAPLISVSRQSTMAPFGTDSVNAVIITSGSVLSKEEANRIVAPGGVVLNNGKRQIVAENPAYGDWTHWRANADNTGVIEDKAFGPSDTLGWLNQSLFAHGLRTADGVVGSFYFIYHEKKAPDSLEEIQAQRLVGRDVYSGVRLWHHNNAPHDTWLMRELFASHKSGFIHPPGDLGQPAVRTDTQTGEITMIYDQGVIPATDHPTSKNRMRPPKNGTFIVFDDYLLQAYGKEVILLEVLTGKRIWRYEAQSEVARAAVSPDRKTIYVQEVADHMQVGVRWGALETLGIAALESKDGSVRWRHDFDKKVTVKIKDGRERPGKLQQPKISALIEFDGVFYGYDMEANLGGDGSGDLYAFDPKTGEFLFHNDRINYTERRGKKVWTMSNNMVAWQGDLYHKGAKIARTAGGKNDWSAIGFRAGNTRCVRLTGSTDWLLHGFTQFMAPDGTVYVNGLVRGNCAMPNYIGYGSLLSVGDMTCSCYNGIRGQAAYRPAARSPFSVISNDQRLSKPSDIVIKPHQVLPPDSPLRMDMRQVSNLRFQWEQDLLTGIIGKDLKVTVDMQYHLVTAYAPDGETVLWQHRADGRLYQKPAANEDSVFIATTSGTITSLDRRTGKPRWRFLAAPDYHRSVVNGQLESRWPVNIALDGENLYASAGRHVELDGGIWLWQLNAKTGKITYGSRLYLPMTRVNPDAANGPGAPHRFRSDRKVVSHSILNGGMTVVDGVPTLISRGWTKKGSHASFAGYWGNLQIRTGEKQDAMMADPENPHTRLMPLKLAEWNGRVLDPIDAFDIKLNKMKYNRQFIWRDHLNLQPDLQAAAPLPPKE